MPTRILLGPSGTGKTFRCLTEVREALRISPIGPPLIFLAPKQATFQIERQLLSDPELPGYTRLQIFSFERLANYILGEFHQTPPKLLTEEGRVMVLRALLSRKRQELKLFRATARLRGFAQQLSGLLQELQRFRMTPEQLLAISGRVGSSNQLDSKLHDLALILRAYLDWLGEHALQDEDLLLVLATELLARIREPGIMQISGLWLDGFGEMTPQEIELLTQLIRFCDQSTLAFNMDREPVGGTSWLSTWTAASQTFRKLHQRLVDSGESVTVDWLERDAPFTRFAKHRIFFHLESHWANPRPFKTGGMPGAGPVRQIALPGFDDEVPPVAETEALPLDKVLRVAICSTHEAEAALAAREIIRFVRSGGRFREAAVIVRQLSGYSDVVRRVFASYDIPFFVDRREPAGHHPFSELTRSAMRTITFFWQPDDWFGALKTGLVHNEETEIDRLENEALARGWRGKVWHHPIHIPDNSDLAAWLEPLRRKLVQPFCDLSIALGPAPAGPVLADGLRMFWDRLQIAEQLAEWTYQSGNILHKTLWDQMQVWLDNIALAFSTETLTLREWLPVLEAGLASQTVGVIPPALDQVMIGAIDRSRNPDLKLALILGVNESVFPAVPAEPNLLTEADREELIHYGVHLGPNLRQRVGVERYLGYIACTRSRERLVLTCAQRDERDKTLNPSPFFAHLQRLFPALEIEQYSTAQSWAESEHVSDLVGPLLRNWQKSDVGAKMWQSLLTLPAFARLRERLDGFHTPSNDETMAPALAELLYGKTLETSVSRLEEFAACPFRFFVTSGLKAEERRRFELDIREQGTFQHEVLARFHHQLRSEQKQWRDLNPVEARSRIARIAENLIPNYREGLLQSSGQTDFAARSMLSALQDFIEVIIGWMPQYDFDPHAVELAFGLEEKPLPAWEIDLDGRHRLSFRGKIDRVDLCLDPESDEALCVVIDYKSSARKLDPVLSAHGIQLQLFSYLNVLRDLRDPKAVFGVSKLVPMGVFYLNLRGKYESAGTRSEVLADRLEARREAYQHIGRFNKAVLPRLDNRQPDRGDQFRFRMTKSGQPDKRSADVLDSDGFLRMLDAVEKNLRRMGQAIFAGDIKINPYRKGSETACDKCFYHSICRIDPWTHAYRVLSKADIEGGDAGAQTSSAQM